MSTTRKVEISEILTAFNKLRVKPPKFPDGMESVVLNYFPLKDGTTLGCCEYFYIIIKETQALGAHVYQNNNNDDSQPSLEMDDDILIVADDARPPKLSVSSPSSSSSSSLSSVIVTSNSSLSTPGIYMPNVKPSLSQPQLPQQQPQTKYKIGAKPIYVNVNIVHCI